MLLCLYTHKSIESCLVVYIHTIGQTDGGDLWLRLGLRFSTDFPQVFPQAIPRFRAIVPPSPRILPHGSPFQNRDLPWHGYWLADCRYPTGQDCRRFPDPIGKGTTGLCSQTEAGRLTGTIRPVLVAGRPIVHKSPKGSPPWLCIPCLSHTGAMLSTAPLLLQNLTKNSMPYCIFCQKLKKWNHP